MPVGGGETVQEGVLKMLMCKVVVVTKIPDNISQSSNGGDYYVGYTIMGYKKHKKSRLRYTYNEWSSNELLEGTFKPVNISHKKVRQMLSKYFDDFKPIIRSPKYYEIYITDTDC